MTTETKLPEAEFYIFLFRLREARVRTPSNYDGTFDNLQQRDDPEARRVFRARLARRMDLDPRFRPAGTPVDHFDDPNLPMTADLFPDYTAFAKPKPEALPHYGLPDERTYFWPPRAVVSPQWKTAVEALEPGVHEFFAHELRFEDATVTDHFLFRARQRVDFLDFDACADVKIETEWDGARVFRLAPAGVRPRRVVGRREPLRGRHWVPSAGHGFVSPALAERLWPLLPPGAELAPIELTRPAPSRRGLAGAAP
jgi:hypothetical protein